MIRKFAQIFAIIFIFSIPLENTFTLGSLGSLSRLIGLATAGIWILSILAQNQIRVLNYFHIIVFIFLLYNVASIFWTVDFDLTYERVITYVQMVVQIWMIWDLLTTEKMYLAGLLAFLLGVYITIADTFINFLSGNLISEYEYGRFSGAGQNAVELALILSLCIPIAWYLAINQKSTRNGNLIKVICYAFIPASLFAMILTGSRTALLAIIPGVIYIIASLHRLKLVYRYIGFILFITLIIFGISIIPQATLARLETIGSSISSGDLGGRGAIWSRSFQIFFDHPLVGIGSGSTVAPDQVGSFSHNTFLSILVELGIIGEVIFLILLGSAVLQIIKQPKTSMILWFTVLFTWIIGVQSLTWEYTKVTWLFLGLIAISAGIIDRSGSLQEAPLINSKSLSIQPPIQTISSGKNP
jgi:O-antigen ligase